MPDLLTYGDDITTISEFKGTLGEFRKAVERLCVYFDENAVVDMYAGVGGEIIFTLNCTPEMIENEAISNQAAKDRAKRVQRNQPQARVLRSMLPVSE